MPDDPIRDLPKWEYKYTTKQTERHMFLELNELGRDGWEAASVTYNKDLKGIWCWTAWLKRPWTGQLDVNAISQQDEANPDAPGEAGAPGFDLSDGDFEFKD